MFGKIQGYFALKENFPTYIGIQVKKDPTHLVGNFVFLITAHFKKLGL